MTERVERERGDNRAHRQVEVRDESVGEALRTDGELTVGRAVERGCIGELREAGHDLACGVVGGSEGEKGRDKERRWLHETRDGRAGSCH